MTTLYRGRLLWTGFPGSTGYTNMFFSGDGGTSPGDMVGGLMDGFAEDIVSLLPGDVTLNVDGAIAVVDDATGDITDYESYTPAGPQNSGLTTTYAAPSGAVIEWITSTVISSRLLRGRTFIVPLKASAYENDGSLSAATVAQLQTAATTVADGTPTLYVWHRPTSKGAADGTSAAVTSIRVPDMAAVLRSRRD